VNVTVAGSEFPLYTRVHQHYGLDDAFDRSVTWLLDQQESRARPAALDAMQRGVASGAALDGDRQTLGAVERGGLGSGSSAGGGRRLAEGHGAVKGRLRCVRLGARADLRRTGGGERDAAPSVAARQTDGRLVAGQGGSRSVLGGGRRHVRERERDSGSEKGAERGSTAALGRRAAGREWPDLLHPCLHDGYNASYRRLGLPGSGQAPATVRLVGR
jgi:hypothetical protein